MIIQKISETETAEAVTCLAYGRSGVGKTFFGGTAGDKALIVNVGRGEETLRSPQFKSIVGANPFIITVDEKMDGKVFQSAVAFDEVSKILDGVLKDNTNGIETIVIDEATALQDYAMHSAVEYNDYSKKSDTLLHMRRKNALIAVVQDYGTQMDLLEQFISYYTKKCKAKNIHFIVLAHEKDVYTKGPKIGDAPALDSIYPGFTGKLAQSVGAYFDWVLRLEAVGGGTNIGYRARTVGDEKLIANVKHGGVFPELVKKPNFREMVAMVKESYKQKTI